MSENIDAVINACKDVYDLASFIKDHITKSITQNTALTDKDKTSLESILEQTNNKKLLAEQIHEKIKDMVETPKNVMTILNTHTHALDIVADCIRLNKFSVKIVEKAEEKANGK